MFGGKFRLSFLMKSGQGLASIGVKRAFVLGGAEVAQRGVTTFAVPESFDLLKQAGLGVRIHRVQRVHKPWGRLSVVSYFRTGRKSPVPLGEALIQ